MSVHKDCDFSSVLNYLTIVFHLFFLNSWPVCIKICVSFFFFAFSFCESNDKSDISFLFSIVHESYQAFVLAFLVSFVF